MVYASGPEFARQMDQEDPLGRFREQFHHPKHGTGQAIYFCGNSLGLEPRRTRQAFEQELSDWGDLAVGGYMNAKNPWLIYQLQFCRPLSSIMGCLEHEVTVMNTLTVNLHLLMLGFYRPNASRYKILM